MTGTTTNKYEVQFTSKDRQDIISGWTVFVRAKDFAEAERIALDLASDHEEIYKIVREYE